MWGRLTGVYPFDCEGALWTFADDDLRSVSYQVATYLVGKNAMNHSTYTESLLNVCLSISITVLPIPRTNVSSTLTTHQFTSHFNHLNMSLVLVYSSYVYPPLRHIPLVLTGLRSRYIDRV